MLARAILEQEFLRADGPDQARRSVLENEHYDVDVIKVTVTEPVCGCDGMTYDNACRAAKAGSPCSTRAPSPD